MSEIVIRAGRIGTYDLAIEVVMLRHEFAFLPTSPAQSNHR